MKRQIRLLGIDDSPFTFTEKHSTVIGVVMRGGEYLEGVLSRQVTIDGSDATFVCKEMIENTRHKKQLRAMMLDGIALGGFNVVDIQEIFVETGLPVITITRDEPNFKGIKQALKKNFEDWVEYNYGSENDLSDEELKDEYSKDYGDDTRLEWSVFLPLGTSSLEQSALVDSSNYLKLLSESYPDMFKNQLEYTNALSDNPDGFKKFINNKGIKITNKNVEIVNSICTRLYKDSKVFGCFRECIGKQKTKQLIQDWLKLIK